MKLEVPSALKIEHAQRHEDLLAPTNRAGTVGDAAR
jgi:hypothetical protein